MSPRKRQTSGRLAAAERFFDLRLKEAQLEQAQCERALAAEDAKKAELDRQRASLDAYRRTLLNAARGVQAATLEQVTLYTSWVNERLEDQRGAVATATAHRDAKRDRTRACFEEITVVRRVGERRRDLAKLEDARQAQRLLDAFAALKIGSEIAERNKSKTRS